MTEPTPAQIALAEAIFDAVEPRGVISALHPYDRWTNQTRTHFIDLAKLREGSQ